MARVVDLTGENVTRQRRKERNFGTKTDLPSTSVERGNTHWTDGSNVNIDGFLGVAGTMTVSGVLSVTGTFNASGDINLSGSTSVTGPLDITGATTIGGSLDVTGPTTIDGVLTINGDTSITGLLEVTGDTTLAGLVDITGNTTITGDLDVDGPTTITGTLGIQGVTTLKNDLNVTTGGKIKAGNLEIEPANGGQINFLNGSLSSTSFGALLNNSIKVELQGPRIDLTSTKTWINGQLEASGIARFNSGVWMGGLPTTSQPANLHITSQGQIFISTATP